jgi:serine/threonine protein kinase
MALLAGTQLGPYQLLSPLGAGGMGEVYRARDTRLDRVVAMKVLPESLATDPIFRERFEREARAIAALSDPHVLAIYDVGLTAESAYLVTELVEGNSLSERLAGGAMPARKAIEYAAQIAQGLAAAHAKGIIHRDLKPENVLVSADGQVKIIDFGLAKMAVPVAVASSTLLATHDLGTTPGTVLGTVGYMAPEQVRGQDVDARADVFALGAILFELVTGQRAFVAESPVETMSAILKSDPLDGSPSKGAMPAAVERIVRHLLEKQPDERYQSARDAVCDLRALLQASTLSETTAVVVITSVGVSRTSEGLRFEAPSDLFNTNLITLGSLGGPVDGQDYDVTQDGQRFLLNLPVGVPQSPLTIVLNWPTLLKGETR